MVQVQAPIFFKRHVFVKFAPGGNLVLSGMVTSLTNSAQLQYLPLLGEVGLTEVAIGTVVFVLIGIGVMLGAGVLDGIEVKVGAFVLEGTIVSVASAFDRISTVCSTT